VTEWPDIPRTERLATLIFNVRIYPEHVAVVAQEWLTGSSRSNLIWQTTVERPPGKTNAECLEAGMYRITRAISDGSVPFSGQDDAT
jgi:hypothetical protein